MGDDGISQIAHILGKDVLQRVPQVAFILCQGGNAECSNRADYSGIKDCRAANIVSGGNKSCSLNCLTKGLLKSSPTNK